MSFVSNINKLANDLTAGFVIDVQNAQENATTAIEQAAIATAMATVCTTIYDNFDDRYLGPKAVAPIVDNDGNALVYGALYFDTTQNFMKVWSNAGWINAGSSVNGTTERYTYHATAGQTVFAATYEAGYIDVFLNGAKLENGVDFTAVTSTDITLTVGANVGDVVDIICYAVFELSTAPTKDVVAYTVSTVEDLASVPSSYTTAIVKDLDRGGTFIWSSTGIANGGTVFAGATGFWTRQYSGAVNVKWFGAVGDGISDDTIAFQNTINYAISNDVVIEDKQGLTIRLTSTIIANQGFTFIGTPQIVKSIGGVDLFAGTFLYFDHTGKGITSGVATDYATDFNFISVGTRRNQPAPIVGWTPNDNDYDFYFEGIADVTFKDCLLLNPTRGIAAYGGGGRFNIYNLRMQPFKVGINIDTVYDVCRIDQLHIWPFWRDDMNVHTYCMNNLDGIISGRNDNPMWSNIFTIFARAGIRFVNGDGGITSKFHLSNCDFDRGILGIWLDSVNSVTGQIVNYTSQGETGQLGSKGLFISGTSTSNSIEATNFRVNECDQNGIRIEGTSNRFSVSNLTVQQFDGANIGYPAIEALSTNIVEILGTPNLSSTLSIHDIKYSPTGIIKVDEWRDFTPVVTSSSGTITTLGTVNGKYKVTGDSVQVAFNIGITTNGTATGGIVFQAPISIPIGTANGGGREINVSGKSLTTHVNGSSVISIYNYDNTHPGTDGCMLSGNITYKAIL